ncbi:MAG: cation diffusion facilitator family transporter, partial [Bacteroidota bacterium]|nr:cation diffusion facilitator family transporter [Bacteroidota bacterium]
NFVHKIYFMSKIKKKRENENYYAYLSIWLSIFGNTILFVIKFWAGIVSSSVAVIADAWHTLSDSISSIIVLISVKVSEKKPTKSFPFGFGRADIIASGFLAMMLAFISFEFLIKGIEKLLDKETANYTLIVYVAMGLTIVFKEIMARVSIFAAKKTGRKSLKADAWHHRSDAIGSIVIIIGVFLSKYFWWIDGVLGIIVSLIIAYTSFEIMRDVAKSIIGTSPEFEEKKKIKKVVNNAANMEVFPHHIQLHSYGSHNELTLHIYLPSKFEIFLAHKITDDIEESLKVELNMIATIHIEPLPDNITNK